jgi:preprotein translocase subunit SecE
MKKVDSKEADPKRARRKRTVIAVICLLAIIAFFAIVIGLLDALFGLGIRSLMKLG